MSNNQWNSNSGRVDNWMNGNKRNETGELEQALASPAAAAVIGGMILFFVVYALFFCPLK